MAVRNQLLDVMHVNQLELIEEPLKYELVTLLAVNGRSSGIIKLSLTVSQGYQHSTTVGTDLLQKVRVPSLSLPACLGQRAGGDHKDGCTCALPLWSLVAVFPETTQCMHGSTAAD